MHLLVRDIQLHPVRDTEPGRGDISRSAWIPGSNTAALPSFQRTCDPSAGTDSSVNVSGRKGTGRKEKEAFLSTYWMLGAFTETSFTLSIETAWQLLPPSERRWVRPRSRGLCSSEEGLSPARSVLGPPVSLPSLLRGQHRL